LSFNKSTGRPLDDSDEDTVYLEAKNIHSKAARRKIIFCGFILIMLLLLFIIYQQGIWKQIPFIPKPALTDDEIALNLSKLYGSITVMTIEGDSMLPALYDGQKVYVASTYYENHSPKRDEIAEISFDSETQYVKRIVAIPGDRFFLKDYVLKLDGSPDVVITPNDAVYSQLVKPDYAIPIGGILVLGDNQNNSWDSRDYGLISIELLSGRIVK
jgi:signal peptidase I